MSALIEWMERAAEFWWSWVAPAFWQTTIVTAVILAIVALGRRWPAPLRYALLLIALLKFAVPPMLSLPTGLFSVVSPRDAVPAVSNSSPLHARPLEFFNENHETHGGGEIVLTKTQANRSWRPVLMWIHGTGVLAMFLWIAHQWSIIRRVKAKARPVCAGPVHEELTSLAEELGQVPAPELFSSPIAGVPMAWGMFRPSIILPRAILEKLSRSELRVILAHEIAHFRRGDLWMNLAQTLILAIWWFHPLCWLLHKKLRNVREDCCDDLLLAKALTSRESYCQMLVRAARELAPVPAKIGALALTENLHPIAQRLVRIMDQRLGRSARLSPVGMVVSVLAASILLPGLKSQQAATKPLVPPGKFDQTAKAVRVPLSEDLFEQERREMQGRADIMRQDGQAFPQQPIPAELKELSNGALIQRLNINGLGGNSLIMREFVNRKDTILPELEKNLTPPLRIARTAQREVMVAAHLAETLRSNAPESLARILLPLLSEPEFRETAARALGFLDQQRASTAPALLKAARSGSSEAARSLIALPNAETEMAQAILDILREKSASIYVRSAIAEMLGHSRLTSHRALVERSLLSALPSSDPRLRRKIVHALLTSRFDSAAAREEITRVFPKPEQARLAGRGELMDLPVTELIGYIREPRVPFEDAAAAQELQFHPVESAIAAIPALIEMLQDEHRSRRYVPVQALARMGKAAEPAIPAILAYMEGASPEKGLAVGALAPIGVATEHRGVFRAVTNALNDADDFTRRRAVVVVPRFGPRAKEAVPQIVSLLSGTDRDTQVFAAQSLWQIDRSIAPRIVPVLIEHLEAGLPISREVAAARLLGEIGPEAHPAIPNLVRLASDETRNPRSRQAAKEAIERIGPSKDL